MIQLFAFLGNPGRQYVRNRHNSAWMLAGIMPFYPSLSWQKKFKGSYSCWQGRHLLLPETFMNLSGEAVLAAASFYKININDILIIHDELELPLGTLSLKFSGGLGGHNGLRSMKAVFSSADFWRLRIGIGRPDSRIPGKGGTSSSTSGEGDVYNWVLSDFSWEETETLNPALEAGAGLIQELCNVEPDTLLKKWAKRKIEIKPEKPVIENIEEKL